VDDVPQTEIRGQRPAPAPSYDDLRQEVQRLARENRAQAEVIAALAEVASVGGRPGGDPPVEVGRVGDLLGSEDLIEPQTARLLLAERLLRSVIEALDGALCFVGLDGTILDANRRWPSPVGSDFFEWCRTEPDLRPLLDDVGAAVRTLIDTDPDAWAEPPIAVKGQIGAPGDRRWVVLRVHPIRDHQLARAVVILIDITEGMGTQENLRRATEAAEQLAAALIQEKTLLTGVISAVPQLVYWKDECGRYAGCNRAYLTLLGLGSENGLVGTKPPRAPDDAIHAALEVLEAEVLRTGLPVLDHKMDAPEPDGHVRSMLLSVLPLDLSQPGGALTRGVIGVGADITHASELERQLAHANRMESIGQLAAGIAHEINTPVQFVTDNTRFVADAVSAMLAALIVVTAATATGAGEPDAGAGEPDAGALRVQVRAAVQGLDLEFLAEELPGALQASLDGLGRVAQIVRAMKDYAHPGHSRSDVDVNRAIESTVQVCRNEWKYVSEVELDLDPQVGLVPAYEGELKQVVLNMVVNAAQAIGDDPRRTPESPLGRIRVSTRRTDTELLIMIGDDGPGMPPEVRDRIFLPFFTTKEVGKGTGQGLSLAHAVIVTKHHGRIDLETAPGQGAAFTLHLPLTPDDAAAPDAEPPDAEPPDAEPPDAAAPDAAPDDAAPDDAAALPVRQATGNLPTWRG
jgi:two-component system, NtrC family, sensor kinase